MIRAIDADHDTLRRVSGACAFGRMTRTHI